MKAGANEVVHVPTVPPAGQSYDVIVRAGALAELPHHAADVDARRYIIISDEQVASLYGARACDDLRAAGLAADLITFPAGEPYKTRATWSGLCDRMLELRCGRDTCVIALGGGVTGDLAGFIAATYMRGLPLIQVPTSLLAMIDASVGGKTGVDTGAGKNLIGAFHAPRLVLADPVLLRTLPDAELRSGLAEAIKHGAILDVHYFEWIAKRADDLLAARADALEPLVRRSIELKAAVVTRDPFEHGERAILNFGHTIGHALERRAGYGLAHGFAVAMGMVAEAAAGERLGVTAAGTVDRLQDVLARCGLPVRPDTGSLDELRAAMLLDKKTRQAQVRLVLLATVGSVARGADGDWTHPVCDATLSSALRAVIDGAEHV